MDILKTETFDDIKIEIAADENNVYVDCYECEKRVSQKTFAYIDDAEKEFQKDIDVN